MEKKGECIGGKLVAVILIIIVVGLVSEFFVGEGVKLQPAIDIQSAHNALLSESTGFFAQAGGIGGNGGNIFYITNLNDGGAGSMREGLTRSEPLILVFENGVNGQLNLTGGDISVNGRKTVWGIHRDGSAADVYIHPKTKSIPFRVNGNVDLIVANMKGDAQGPNDDAPDYVGIRGPNNKVWVHHVTGFGDGSSNMDGFVDTASSDYGTANTFLTVSWSRVERWNNVFGMRSDTKATFHHNYLISSAGRQPKLTQTSKAHLYNNWLVNWGYDAVRIDGGEARIENNVFEAGGDKKAIQGRWAGSGNALLNGANADSTSSGVFTPTYPYSLEPVSTLAQQDALQNALESGAGWQGVAAPPGDGGGAVCGNNIIEGSEVCDGNKLNGQTCQSKGFDGGNLACNSGCTGYIMSGCTTIVPECSSNNDCNDGLFCNGVETCSGGSCKSGSSQCTGAGQTCNEGTDSCDNVVGGSQTIEKRISAGSDDAEENSVEAGTDIGSSDLELNREDVSTGGPFDQTVGLRFTSLTIPKGAQITNAYIQFKVDEVSSEVTSINIQGEGKDNAPTFSTADGSVISRTKTSAKVTWNIPAWNTVGEMGSNQRTPNIASVIQEIVNRQGWQSGNSIVILTTGTGKRVAESFEGDSSGAPLLHIEYSVGQPAVCGDGKINNGEACDDGNTVGGDGCDSQCNIEISGNIKNVPGDYSTIQNAINAAKNGDVVLVAPGTYNENLVISGKTITVASKYYTTKDESFIQSTIIDGGNGLYVFNIDDTVGAATTVQGFTIRDARDGFSSLGTYNILNNRFTGLGDSIDFESGGGVVRNNVFLDSKDDAIDLDEDTAAIIENNMIFNSGNDGIEIRLHPYTGTKKLVTIIRNNTIMGTDEDGIQLISYDVPTNREFIIDRNIFVNIGAAGIGIMDGSNTNEDFRAASISEKVVVTNNVFKNYDHGISGGDNVVALNNIFVGGNKFRLVMKNVDGNSKTANNLFWEGSATSGSNIDSITTINADPRMENNYRLKSGSPAIDAGVSSYTWNGQQVLNIVGYTGSAPDLGVFEFTGVVSVAVCGNSIVETGEQCDDGNTVNGDGCNSTCQNEDLGGGDDGGTSDAMSVCGDGKLESGEECDDGNKVSGDGCSSRCGEEFCGDNLCAYVTGESCNTCSADCGTCLGIPEGGVKIDKDTTALVDIEFGGQMVLEINGVLHVVKFDFRDGAVVIDVNGEETLLADDRSNEVYIGGEEVFFNLESIDDLSSAQVLVGLVKENLGDTSEKTKSNVSIIIGLLAIILIVTILIIFLIRKRNY